MSERYIGKHRSGVTRHEYTRRDFLGVAGITAGLSIAFGLGIGPSLKGILDDLNNSSFDLAKDINKAHALELRDGHLFPNPIARTNMSLLAGDIRLNPDQRFTNKQERPFTKPASAKLRRELKQLHRAEDPDSGQKLTTLKLNWDKFEDGEIPIVVLASYHNELSGATTNRRLEELARQTGRAVFGINMPKEDGSDDYTEKQLKSFEEGRGFAELSRAMLRIMEAEGITEFDASAQSAGARILASLARYAAEFPIEVRMLHLVEPTGVEDFTIGELKDNFFSEAKYLDMEQSFPYDPEMRIAGGFSEHPLIKFIGGPIWVFQGISRDPHFYVAHELAKGTLQEDLEFAYYVQSRMTVKIVSGSLSSICTHSGALDMVDSVKKDGYPISWASFPGEHHTVLENAVRYGANARLFFSQKSPRKQVHSPPVLV